MNLFIDNSAGDSYELKTPKKWLIDVSSLRARVTQQKRYGKAGANIMGDRNYDARTIKLSTDITGQIDSTIIDLVNEIFSLLTPDKLPCYLRDADNARRAKIEITEFDPRVSRDGMEYKWHVLTIPLIMPDVFWESTAETEIDSPSAGIDSGETLTIQNDGVAEAYPVILVTCVDSNSNFSLINDTTGGIITIGSNAFVPGTSIEIDCQNGTIYLSDGISRAEISSAMADNTGYLFFQPGENILRYDSAFGAIGLNITFRERSV